MRKYLIITGILATIAVLIPGIVVIGFIFFVIPGIILLISPTIFIYPLIIHSMKSFISSLIQRILITVLLGCLVALLLNIPVWQKVSKLTSNDISSPKPIKLSGTIAIFELYNFDKNDQYGNLLCNRLCQRLLYSGTAKKVLVGYDYPGSVSESSIYPDDIKNYTMVGFTIEKKDKCPAPAIPTNTGETDIIKKITAGECLIVFKEDIVNADFILVDRLINDGKLPYIEPWNIFLDTIRARRFEVIKPHDGEYTVLDRRTQVEYDPLFMPLAIGIAGSNGLEMRLGYARYSSKKNIYANGYSQIEDYYKSLFGESYTKIREISGEQFRKILISILGNNSYDRNLKTREFDIFFSDINKNINKNYKLTDEDINIIILSLNDPGVKQYWGLSGIIYSHGSHNLIKLLPYILKRAMPDEDRETIRSLADAISAFSQEDIVPYKHLVEKFYRDKQAMLK